MTTARPRAAEWPEYGVKRPCAPDAARPWGWSALPVPKNG